MKNYKLPIGDGQFKELSYSMNFVYNLQQLTGKDLITWGKEVDELTELEQGRALCDVVFCALTAYDQEEGNTIDYNQFKVIKWVSDLPNDEKGKLIASLHFHTKPPVEAGK